MPGLKDFVLDFFGNASERVVGLQSELDLTCLMPCLNEAETLSLCIKQAQESINRIGVTAEIVIADNGSTDGSQQIAEALGARVVIAEQRGYGSALQIGIAAAKGKHVIMGDADGSYTWDKLDSIYESLAEGSDLVMGNRFGGEIFPNAMPFLNRYLGNPILSALGRFLFKIKIRDFHCGLRGFDREKVLKLGIASPGMEFASEMVIKCSLSDFSISEVPTDLRPDGRSRQPHLRPLPDGWRHLRLMLSYSPKWSMRIPGLVLFTFGLTLSFLTVFASIFEFQISFGVHSALIGVTLIILGFQGILSSFISELAISVATPRRVSPIARRIQQAESLDAVILAGMLFALLGFIAILFSFSMWRQAGFGDLRPDEYMKILLPAVALTILGLQTTLSAFLVETLRVLR